MSHQRRWPLAGLVVEQAVAYGQKRSRFVVAGGNELRASTVWDRGLGGIVLSSQLHVSVAGSISTPLVGLRGKPCSIPRRKHELWPSRKGNGVSNRCEHSCASHATHEDRCPCRSAKADPGGNHVCVLKARSTNRESVFGIGASLMVLTKSGTAAAHEFIRAPLFNPPGIQVEASMNKFINHPISI